MGKDTYEMNIAGLDRSLQICPLTKDLSIAGFILFGDPELVTACAKALLEKAPEFDYIITAEAKGIPLANEMARLSGNRKYIVARKKDKAYMKNTLAVKVQSITTKGEQTLFLNGVDVELMKGSRILLVDDVVSTGESLSALEMLTKEAGGTIAGKMTVLAEGEAANRDDLIYLNPLPLFTPEGEPIE